jgi:hypothetical protein
MKVVYSLKINIYKIKYAFVLDTRLQLSSSLKNKINNDQEQQIGYLQLLEQRELESQQEVAKLIAEIRSLKLQIRHFKGWKICDQ